MTKKPVVSYKFYQLTDDEKKTIQDIVEKNLTVKMDSYLKKIYSKNENAKVLIEYKVLRDKKGRYESSFRFTYDGKYYVYKNKVPFKNLDDLINHAFDHFKRDIE